MVTWPPPHQISLGTALHMHLGNPTNHSAHALIQLHLQKPLSHIRSHVQVRALGRNVCGEALQPIADTKGKSSQIPALFYQMATKVRPWSRGLSPAYSLLIKCQVLSWALGVQQ